MTAWVIHYAYSSSSQKAQYDYGTIQKFKFNRRLPLNLEIADNNEII